jgi:hypothetical protein
MGARLELLVAEAATANWAVIVGAWRVREDLVGHAAGTVRDREAPNGVITAKMTADMANGGGRI